MRRETFTDLMFGCFDAAMGQDHDEVGRCLKEIAGHGLGSVYVAVASWAKICVEILDLDDDEPGTMAVVQSGHGLDDGDPMLWASRFIAALANRDAPTCVALFMAAARADDGDTLALATVTMLRCAVRAMQDRCES